MTATATSTTCVAQVEVAATRWSVLGASVAGAGHLAAGLPGQDAHAWAMSDDGRLVLAVADGAGSAPCSERGAAAAVLAAVGAPDDPVGAARAAVMAAAAASGTPPSHLASTLLVCVVGGDEIVGWAVGDGAVILEGRAGMVALLPPEHGEYRNETVFITSDGWESSVRRVASAVDEVAGVAVMSDGLELLALDVGTGTPHAPFFAPLLRFARGAGRGAEDELASFLSSERVAARTDDDCSLLLAVRAA